MLTAPKGDLKPQKKPDMKHREMLQRQKSSAEGIFFTIIADSGSILKVPHTHHSDLHWPFSSKHPGHTDNYKYRCVKWTIITRMIGNFLFITLLTCKEKKKKQPTLANASLKGKY